MSSWISKLTTTFRSNWLFSSHRSGSKLGMSLPIWVSLRAAPLLRAATDLNRSRGGSSSAPGAAQPARVWKEPLSITIGEGVWVRYCTGSSRIGSGEAFQSWNEKIWHTGPSLEAILKMCNCKIQPTGGSVSQIYSSWQIFKSLLSYNLDVCDFSNTGNKHWLKHTHTRTLYMTNPNGEKHKHKTNIPAKWFPKYETTPLVG